MAVKYQIPFYDDANQLWRVDIDLPSYIGDPIELTGIGRVFCQPEWGYGGNDDPYYPIINSKVQVQFYNRGGEVDVQELQHLTDMEGRLYVYRDTELWWTGYITADGIQRMLQPNPYPITINATDGIALLKDVPFDFTGDWRLPVPASSYAPIGIIRYILNGAGNLNMPLPLRFQSDVESVVYNDNAMYGTLQWGALGEAWNYFDSDNRKSAGEILENLLKAFQCRLFQFGGRWHIMRINDVVQGSYDWTEISATTGIATATTGTTDLLADMESYYRFVGENQVMTVSPPLTDVVATYNQYQAENILPNGDLDRWTSFNLLYWGFVANPDGQLSYQQYEALDGRQDGYAVQLTHALDGTPDEEGVFTFAGGLPLDANILYKRFTFGFMFMPIEYPFDGNEQVVWDTNPLKISIRYVLPVEGAEANYYLNEFGYWQNAARGTDLGVLYVTRETSIISAGILLHELIFEGTPNIGDTIISAMKSSPTGSIQEWGFTVTAIEEGNLELALQEASAAIANPNVNVQSVVMDNPTRGRIRIQMFQTYGNPYGRTEKSGALQEFQFIYPTVDQLKRLDIASIQFQGRGGNSEILIPDPGLLDGDQVGETGKLFVEFYLKEGQRIVLDNIFLRVDENHDVYRSSVQASQKRSNKQEVSLGISSSFNGFYLSNVMTSYSESNNEFVMTDGKYTGSLTGMTANAMMRFRYESSEVFSGSLHTSGHDWMFHHIYELNGKKFLPLSTKYNIEQCQIDVTAIECRDGDPVLVEQHYGSNDTILSNV